MHATFAFALTESRLFYLYDGYSSHVHLSISTMPGNNTTLYILCKDSLIGNYFRVSPHENHSLVRYLGYLRGVSIDCSAVPWSPAGG